MKILLSGEAARGGGENIRVLRWDRQRGGTGMFAGAEMAGRIVFRPELGKEGEVVDAEVVNLWV